VKRLILMSVLICLLTAGFSLADEGKYETNTVYLDKVTAKPGEHFAVNVYLYNVDSLAGMQVPIFFRSDKIDLYCDSVSFAKSRCEYMMFNDIKIPENEQGVQDKVVYFSFISTIDPESYVPSLQAGDGIVATIYFTAPEDCEEGVVKLTRGMIPHPHISFIFAVWDPMGDNVDGDFIENEIIIKK